MYIASMILADFCKRNIKILERASIHTSSASIFTISSAWRKNVTIKNIDEIIHGATEMFFLLFAEFFR